MNLTDETLQYMQDLLPDFIDEKYPKGETKERGVATVACMNLIFWLKERNEKP